MNERPITPDVVRLHRQSLLAFASRLTFRREDPRAVLANATALEAWLNAATGPGDKRNRMEALSRADSNRDNRRPADDNPASLIADAEVFYKFLKAA